MRKILDAIRRNFGLFDSNGVRFTQRHYERVKHDIIDYPLNKQARYANLITVSKINDTRFLKRAFLPYSEKEPNYIFPNFNAMSVGNLAYIQLNAPTKHYRDKAENLLTAYAKWLKWNVRNKQL